MKPDQEKLRGLAADYFLRELSDDELETLQEALRADPELGEFFIKAARDEWLMSDYQEYRRAKMILFPKRKRQQTRIRQIAAAIAVLLSLATIFIAQRTAIPQVSMEEAMRETSVVASVKEISARPGTAVSAVNKGYVRELKFGDMLYDGDYIVVPSGGKVDIAYSGEETLVKLTDNSIATLLDEQGAKLIRLNQGHLLADVQRQPDGKPMRIKTPDAQAVVLGTTFEVVVEGITKLMVSSGRVQFTPHYTGKPVDVGAGEQADTSGRLGQDFETEKRYLHPVEEATIGMKYRNINLSVDSKRNHSALLKFDLGEPAGRTTGAELRLRVVNRVGDRGGEGTIRLFSVPSDMRPESAENVKRIPLAVYHDRVNGGEDLVFTINPSDLKEGINAFVIAMDKQRDDFWISSSEGEMTPMLILKTIKQN